MCMAALLRNKERCEKIRTSHARACHMARGWAPHVVAPHHGIVIIMHRIQTGGAPIFDAVTLKKEVPYIIPGDVSLIYSSGRRISRFGFLPDLVVVVIRAESVSKQIEILPFFFGGQ